MTLKFVTHVPYTVKSKTSKDAAKSMESIVGPLCKKVLSLIAFGGLTCDELEDILNLPHQTVSARVWELHKANLIADSLRRRKTKFGKWAVVWVSL